MLICIRGKWVCLFPLSLSARKLLLIIEGPLIIIIPLANWMFENDGLPFMGTMHVIMLPRAHRASYSAHQVRTASTAKPDGTKWPPYTSIQTKLMSYLAGIEPHCPWQTKYGDLIWLCSVSGINNETSQSKSIIVLAIMSTYNMATQGCGIMLVKDLCLWFCGIPSIKTVKEADNEWDKPHSSMISWIAGTH